MRSLSLRGFTLIEVLVAVFVLAIGILGATATQLTAQRTRQDSAQFARAVQLADALAERMRANPDQMRLPDSTNPYLQLRYNAAIDGLPGNAVSCYTANCNPGQLAAFDVGEVKQSLYRTFPHGRARVCRDTDPVTWNCSGGARAPVVIKLGWDERQGAAVGEAAPRLMLVLGELP